VGVNCFTIDAPADVPLFRVDEAATARQVERVRELRTSRDDAAVRNALSEIAAVARAGENLLPPILTAVKAYATVGEICRVLAGEFGEYCEAFHSA
jgi:methylmalonyl-CoA mutase N-terminal domain/subunit